MPQQERIDHETVCVKVGAVVGTAVQAAAATAAVIREIAESPVGKAVPRSKLISQAAMAAILAGALKDEAAVLAEQACEQVLSEAKTISDKISNNKSSTVGADISEAAKDSEKGSGGVGGGGGLRPVIIIP